MIRRKRAKGARVKINRYGQSKVLTPKEYSKIRKQLPYEWQKLLFEILWYTGERVGAVAQLEWRYVYEKPGKPRDVILFNARTRKSSADRPASTRTVPVHENLIAPLTAYELPWKETKWMFPGRDNESHVWRQTVDAALRTACDRAGLGGKGISTHSFRRTLITRLSDKGVSARTIQQVTGHASLNSVQTYIDCDERKIKEAIDLL